MQKAHDQPGPLTCNVLNVMELCCCLHGMFEGSSMRFAHGCLQALQASIPDLARASPDQAARM